MIDKAVLKIAKDKKTSASELFSLAGRDVVLDRLLAKHPNASAELLEILVHSEDSMTLRNISTHPNLTGGGARALAKSLDAPTLKRLVLHPSIPLDVLLNIAPGFPQIFYLNPALTWEAISSSNLPANLDAQSRLALLKKRELPAPFLRWFAINGTREERMLAANHFGLPEDVRLQLESHEDAEISAAAAKLRMAPDRHLRGRYPAKLSTEMKGFQKALSALKNWEYKLLFSNKHLLQSKHSDPDCIFSDSQDIEYLHLSSTDSYLAYVVVENLPNLKWIEVNRTFIGNSLQWLICRNLPSLEKVTVEGGLRWIEIEDAPNLVEIDLRKNPKIDHLDIRNAGKLQQVQIDGCQKLRGVKGLFPGQAENLNVDQQIQANQKKSKRKGRLYENMTFTDIDEVISKINAFAKFATKKGWLPEDFLYQQEDNPDFDFFRYRILAPLEPVYTGGTGETYAYEAIIQDYSHGKIGSVSARGWSEPEGCIREALIWMIDLGLEIPGYGRWSEKKLLEYIAQAGL